MIDPVTEPTRGPKRKRSEGLPALIGTDHSPAIGERLDAALSRQRLPVSGPNLSQPMKRALVALALVVAGALAGVSALDAGASTATAEAGDRNGAPLQALDGLQDTIERIDRLLESVADLLETVRTLVGGGGGGD